MFFRRRKKGQERPPSDDFLDEDFGYESSDDSGEPADRSSPPSRRKRRDESEVEEPEDHSGPSRRSAARGRSLDDDTMVGGVSGDSSPRLTPGRSAPTPPPRPPSAEAVPQPPMPEGPPTDENLPDATMVIGHAIAPSVASVAWLVVATGPSRGRDHRLADTPTRIGTAAECGLRLPADQYVSSVHAEIRRDGADWVLTDLGSTNGTFQNTERITEVRLQDGDRVRFGLSDFVFKSCRL